jgi:hypothetical protein
VRQKKEPTGDPAPQPIVRSRPHNGHEQENQEAQKEHGCDGFLHSQSISSVNYYRLLSATGPVTTILNKPFPMTFLFELH